MSVVKVNVICRAGKGDTRTSCLNLQKHGDITHNSWDGASDTTEPKGQGGPRSPEGSFPLQLLTASESAKSLIESNSPIGRSLGKKMWLVSHGGGTQAVNIPQ